MSDEIYVTETGKVLTADDIQALADEAERGYDVPDSAYPHCLDCDRPVDPADMLALREVTGFKKHRNQGGQNHVLYPRETGRVLCGGCAIRWKSTAKARTTPEQESLL